MGGACTRLPVATHDVCLPSKDSDPSSRKSLLKEARKNYVFWEHDNLPPHIKKLPAEEAWPGQAKVDFVEAVTIGKFSEIVGEAMNRFKPLDEIHDVRDFYQFYTMPVVARTWSSDYEFAQQRLNGVNPQIIKLCTAIPEGFHVKDAHVKHLLGKENLASLIAARRLFICDYEMLDDMPCREGLYTAAPFALFYTTEGRLMPLAVQLEREKRSKVRKIARTRPSGTLSGSASMTAPSESAAAAASGTVSHSEDQEEFASDSDFGLEMSELSEQEESSSSGSKSEEKTDSPVPIFTPPAKEDPDNFDQNAFKSSPEMLTWTYVKMFVQNADGHAHQFIYHLCHTHLISEATWIAARRTLSERHPIHEILKPHFKVNLAINNEARKTLLGVGGAIDLVFSGGFIGVAHSVQRAWAEYDWEARDFKTDLDARGVRDPGVLSDYHFRDYGLLLYQCIMDYCTHLLGAYYTSADEIANDTELKAFHAEMISETGAHFKNFALYPTSVEELAHIVGRMIFTASVGHAAINFPQWNYMAFPPNYPLTLHRPPPTGPRDIKTEEKLVNGLPNTAEIAKQILFGKFLTTPSESKLGYFEKDNGYRVVNPVFGEAAMQFQRALTRARQQMENSNKKSDIPYIYMYPEGIPNSTSV